MTLRRTPAITSGEEMTMTDEKNAAEPSAASAGSLAYRMGKTTQNGGLPI